MSSEPSDTAEADHSDSTPKPTKAPSKDSTAADKLKAKREEQQRMIGYILPQAKNKPELYQRVVANLKSTKLGQTKKWMENGLVKNMSGWLAVAKKGERPDLERLVTALAIFDCYSTKAHSKFSAGLAQHGLREWAIRELEGGRASTEEGSPETPREPKKAPKVKQETILPSIEIDQIAPCASSTAPQGLKRQAENAPAEHPPKRMISESDYEALIATVGKVARLEEALAAQQQRTSSRNFGTQTSPSPTENNAKLPSSVTEQLGKHNRALADQTRVLYEQGRALVDLPTTIREIVRHEIQRAIAPVSSDSSIFQRSQAHGQSYTVIANQSASSYPFDTNGDFQMVEAPQGRAAGGRFNTRYLQPGVFDFDIRH